MKSLLERNQGRIQDFLIGGEPNNLGSRGKGTNKCQTPTSQTLSSAF